MVVVVSLCAHWSGLLVRFRLVVLTETWGQKVKKWEGAGVVREGSVLGPRLWMGWWVGEWVGGWVGRRVRA